MGVGRLAIEAAPELRQQGRGRSVSLDGIMEALKVLDSEAHGARGTRDVSRAYYRNEPWRPGFAIMEEDDPELPPIAPPFQQIHRRRGLIVWLDKAAQAYWQTLVAEGEPLAEAAVERAYERYASNGGWLGRDP